MRTIDGDGREVVQIGESFAVSGNVLTNDTITAYELAHKYNKSITALVNGQYVGWGYTPSFINISMKMIVPFQRLRTGTTESQESFADTM